MNRNLTRSLSKRHFAQKTTPKNTTNNLSNNDTLNKERLKQVLNAAERHQISPEAKNEEIMKRWMNKFVSKGQQNDIEDVEEMFDENLKDNDGWVTDKVWTGKQIPHEFLEDDVNLDKMMGDDWNGEYEYDYEEDITESVIKHNYPIPDEKPISEQGEEDAEEPTPVEGMNRDESTIEAIIKDNKEVHNIFQNLKKEEDLDDASMEQIKEMLENNQGEFLNMWNSFEKEHAKEISQPKSTPPVPQKQPVPSEADDEDSEPSNSSLLEAIKQTTPDLLIKLCKNPMEVGLRHGESALHVAVILNAKHFISVLIEKYKYFVDVETHTRTTPLHLACIKHNPEIIKILLKHKANPNKGDVDGVTPLHLLIESDAPASLVESLIYNGAFVNEVDYHQNTPLHVACYNGRLEHAKILIRNNADVNKRTEDQMTALHLACETGHFEIVKLLCSGIKQKAPKTSSTAPIINNQNPERKSKKHEQEDEEDDEGGHFKRKRKDGQDRKKKEEERYESLPTAIGNLAKLELNALTEKGVTPLRLAVSHGHIDIVKHLIEKGSNVNSRDPMGSTPLHVACLLNHSRLVSILLSHGSLPDALTEDDWAPLHIACQQGNLECIEALLAAGATVYKKNCDGATPLLIACDAQLNDDNSQLDSICRTLIDHNANVNAQDKDGNTPLLLLCQMSGMTELIQFMIERGANVNARTEDFVRPIHMALQEGQYDVAKILVENGAQINHETSEGYTTLHLAALRANIPWARYFLLNGVKLNAMANDGSTALSIAKKSQKHEFEAFLRNEFGAKDIDVFSIVEDQIESEERR
jgi:ankyrin repeat protein